MDKNDISKLVKLLNLQDEDEDTEKKAVEEFKSYFRGDNSSYSDILENDSKMQAFCKARASGQIEPNKKYIEKIEEKIRIDGKDEYGEELSESLATHENIMEIIGVTDHLDADDSPSKKSVSSAKSILTKIGVEALEALKYNSEMNYQDLSDLEFMLVNPRMAELIYEAAKICTEQYKLAKIVKKSLDDSAGRKALTIEYKKKIMELEGRLVGLYIDFGKIERLGTKRLGTKRLEPKKIDPINKLKDYFDALKKEDIIKTTNSNFYRYLENEAQKHMDLIHQSSHSIRFGAISEKRQMINAVKKDGEKVSKVQEAMYEGSTWSIRDIENEILTYLQQYGDRPEWNIRPRAYDFYLEHDIPADDQQTLAFMNSQNNSIVNQLQHSRSAVIVSGGGHIVSVIRHEDNVLIFEGREEGDETSNQLRDYLIERLGDSVNVSLVQTRAQSNHINMCGLIAVRSMFLAVQHITDNDDVFNQRQFIAAVQEEARNMAQLNNENKIMKKSSENNDHNVSVSTMLMRDGMYNNYYSLPSGSYFVVTHAREGNIISSRYVIDGSDESGTSSTISERDYNTIQSIQNMLDYNGEAETVEMSQYLGMIPRHLVRTAINETIISITYHHQDSGFTKIFKSLVKKMSKEFNSLKAEGYKSFDYDDSDDDPEIEPIKAEKDNDNISDYFEPIKADKDDDNISDDFVESVDNRLEERLEHNYCLIYASDPIHYDGEL